MAYTRGRCTNIDYCALAADRRDIEVRIGGDFVCPDCARALSPPPAAKAGGGLGLLLAAAAAALVLVGGGAFAGYRLAGPGGPSLAAATRQADAAHLARGPVRLAAAQAQPAILLRIESAQALAPAAARLAAAYLASQGDTLASGQAAGGAGNQVVTGMRFGHPEAIAISIAGAPALTGKPAEAADIVLADRASPQDGEHLLGFVAAAVVVNPRNAVPALTVTQLRGILDGSVADWSQIGGVEGPIHLMASTDRASDGLGTLVPDAPPVPAGTPRMADVAASVLADENAMSFVKPDAVGAARPLAVLSGEGTPVLPGASAIASRLYPLARPIYLSGRPTLARGNGANLFAARFAAYALSQEGQAEVAASGLVPAHIEVPASPLAGRDRDMALVRSATRLAADLHPSQAPASPACAARARWSRSGT